MNKEEKIFKEFLEEYLNNVKSMLPESYRAQQLNKGTIWSGAVYLFETKFLKEPFMNAIKKVRK